MMSFADACGYEHFYINYGICNRGTQFDTSGYRVDHTCRSCFPKPPWWYRFSVLVNIKLSELFPQTTLVVQILSLSEHKIVGVVSPNRPGGTDSDNGYQLGIIKHNSDVAPLAHHHQLGISKSNSDVGALVQSPL